MKFVNTTDDSIGGMLHPDGKLTVATVIDGVNAVEIIEDLEKVKDLVEGAAPIASKILQAIVNIFSSICQPFPPVIIQNGKHYRWTIQKAPWGAIDRMFYMEVDTKEVILYHEHKTIGGVRGELRKELKEYGYIK